MVLTQGDLEHLKQLRAAGGRGRDVRELNIRVTLDRLVKGGYLVGRPIGRDSVQYRWNRRGYLRSPRWFSWAWTRDGERVASINVETQRHAVTLKYRSRSYGEDWSDVEQRVTIAWTPCRFGGERQWFVCSVA